MPAPPAQPTQPKTAPSDPKFYKGMDVRKQASFRRANATTSAVAAPESTESTEGFLEEPASPKEPPKRHVPLIKSMGGDDAPAAHKKKKGGCFSCCAADDVASDTEQHEEGDEDACDKKKTKKGLSGLGPSEESRKGRPAPLSTSSLKNASPTKEDAAKKEWGRPPSAASQRRDSELNTSGGKSENVIAGTSAYTKKDPDQLQRRPSSGNMNPIVRKDSLSRPGTATSSPSAAAGKPPMVLKRQGSFAATPRGADAQVDENGEPVGPRRLVLKSSLQSQAETNSAEGGIRRAPSLRNMPGLPPDSPSNQNTGGAISGTQSPAAATSPRNPLSLSQRSGGGSDGADLPPKPKGSLVRKNSSFVMPSASGGGGSHHDLVGAGARPSSASGELRKAKNSMIVSGSSDAPASPNRRTLNNLENSLEDGDDALVGSMPSSGGRRPPLAKSREF